jgi:polyisoprenyl-teichoic acid--peptidoglycan teichoic acid transferase
MTPPRGPVPARTAVGGSPGARPASSRAAARRRRAHRRRWLRAATVGTLVLVAVAMAGGYGYARLQVGQVASVHLPGLAPAPPPGRPMNLLVVGSDTRQSLRSQDRGRFGAVQGQRGDVILLVHLVPATHRAWLLSIPRDLYVPVAGTGSRAKINAALSTGPEQLVETIRGDLGIPVSHYLLVDFDGFRAVVDAIGGIRLDFPYPVRDDDQDHNNSGLVVATPGCRHLDGTQALALARSRYYQYRGADGVWHPDPGYDLGRIRRQQVLLRALAAQALRRGLTNPLRANAVLTAAANHLTRDDTLTTGEAVRLAVQFHAFRPDTLVGLTIPTVPALRRGDVVLRPGQPGFQQAWAEGGWEQILLPVQPATRQTVARFLGRPGPAHPSPSAPTRPAPREPWDPRPC